MGSAQGRMPPTSSARVASLPPPIENTSSDQSAARVGACLVCPFSIDDFQLVDLRGLNAALIRKSRRIRRLLGRLLQIRTEQPFGIDPKRDAAFVQEQPLEPLPLFTGKMRRQGE